MATEKLDSTQILPRVYVEDDKFRGVGHLNTSIVSPDGQNGLDVNPDGSINVAVVSGGTKEPVFEQQEVGPITAPVAPVEVFTYVAMDDQNAVAVHVTANIDAIWRVYLDGTLIRLHRTSPAERNGTIRFEQNRPLLNMATLSVEIEIPTYNQHGSKEYHTFVSYEGYKV